MSKEIFRSFYRELKKSAPVSAQDSLELYQSFFSSLDNQISETHLFEQVRGNEVLINQAKEEIREAIEWVVANVPSLQNSESAPLARYNIEKCIQATCKAIYRLTEPFYDPLTGALTRSFLKEWRKLEKQNYTIILVDLDNFKNLNDTLGHQEGDKHLQQASQHFSSVMRYGQDL